MRRFSAFFCFLTFSNLLLQSGLFSDSKGSHQSSQSHTCHLQTSLPHNADTSHAQADSITNPPTPQNRHTSLIWPRELVLHKF